jgi:phosphopantetheinyl transferase
MSDEEGKTRSLRWAVDVRQFCKPKSAEWATLLALCSAEEQARVGRYMFDADKKRALVGRLLIQRAVLVLCCEAGVTRSDMRLGRTPRGKPILLAPEQPGLCFNISHHGNFVILAAESGCSPDTVIGCDVMTIEIKSGRAPRKQSQQQQLAAFFHDMRHCFTEKEWGLIRDQTGFEPQLRAFMTFWTMKECIVKALGVGIHENLQSIEFHPKEVDGKAAAEALTTEVQFQVRLLEEEGGQFVEAPEWSIQRCTLDELHVAAVMIRSSKAQLEETPPLTFQLCTVEDFLPQ